MRACGKSLDPYHLLAGIVHPGDTIITLNYDLFLDRALFERLEDPIEPAIALSYGATFIGVRTCNERPYEQWRGFGGWKGAAASWADDAVAVLKLHGAIDWLRCPACLNVYCTPGTPATSDAIRKMLVDDKHFIDSHSKRYRNPCCTRYDPRKLEPCIVAPTPRKDIVGSPLADIWDVARERLGRATELIFIGYALRSTDKHVRDLIAEACAYTEPRILVINRDGRAPLRGRYEALGKMLNVKPRFWHPRNLATEPSASAWIAELFSR